MGGTRETPRQRMIAVMYLILTALLALNVSKEVVDAFLVVNESVEQSNKIFRVKLFDTYSAFNRMYQLNQKEVLPFWNKGQKVKRLSREITDYILKLKHEVIAVTEGISIDSAKVVGVMDLKKKDNYSVTTRYFMGDSHDGSGGVSRELKINLNQYRDTLLSLLSPEEQQRVSIGLQTDSVYYNADGQKQNWEAHHFYHTILAADITILNKLIAEVQDAEYQVVNTLMESVNATDFSYDQINAKVIPKSNYVFVGEDYTAEIFVAAYDTTQSPKIYLRNGVDTLGLNELNKAVVLQNGIERSTIRIPAIKTGINKYAGMVGVLASSGDTNYFPFSQEFIVAQPNVTISVDEMNVLYIGVDNTISLSVAGIPMENLTPQISHGSIRKSTQKGKWIVNVAPGSNYTQISVKSNINGVSKIMGTQRFRIKRLPDPIASIANKREGYINRRILLAAAAIVPRMPQDFGFDMYFEIVSFKMKIQRGFNVFEYEGGTGLLTEEMTEQIELTNRGQTIIFENIKAKGPYGDIRDLSPIILTID